MTGFPPPMTIAEARTILADHQRWRRGEIDAQKYSARLVGQALDLLLAATGPRPSPEHAL